MIAYRLDIKTGDLIDGKYTVIDRIGSGSYGDVYKVKDLRGNNYALKLLRLWEVSNELHDPLVAKFDQEYKTGKLTSEYLIHSLDFGVVKGNPYLLMEYCPSGDLSKLIGKDLSKLPSFAHDILEGLHTLHSEGKVHRDLKPENVLIRNNGKAALTDFGVVGEMDQSKRMSEVGWWKKRPKQVQGTPLYMAPEMANRVGGGVTYLPTVDIWSFGVMMFELLTGSSFPFGNIEKIEGAAIYAGGADHMVPRLTDIETGEEIGRLPGRCQHCRDTALQSRYSCGDRIIGGILQTRIEIAVVFEIEESGHILGRIVLECCALYDGNLPGLAVSGLITRLDANRPLRKFIVHINKFNLTNLLNYSYFCSDSYKQI